MPPLARTGSLTFLGVLLALAALVFTLHQGAVSTGGAAGTLTLVGVSVTALLSVLGVAVLMARRLARRTGPRDAAELTAASMPRDQRTGFVMDTFQQVLSNLKDKESDLKRLQTEAVARAEQVESYNEDILRSIASGVITCDSRGVITTFNAAAERILSYQAHDVIGRRCDHVFGAESPIAAMVEQSLSERVSISRREWSFARGADRKWVGLSSTLLRDKGDCVIGATIVFTDLTEIKRLEEQIEAEHRLSFLGEMSAGIAHEFRNYMGTIRGWGKLLASRLPEHDAGRPMAEAIIQELDVMQRLTEDLLAFGRDLRPQREPVILRHLLADAAKVVAALPNVRLDLDVAPEVPATVAWDSTLMRQAVKNVIQNAAEAMPEGGCVAVGVTCLPARSDWIEVAITDTGVGIPQDCLSRIFLPFFTRKAKGHGLGLALVQKIVLAHQGRIRVQSQEGVGTTFFIDVPVAEVLAAVPSYPAAAAA